MFVSGTAQPKVTEGIFIEIGPWVMIAVVIEFCGVNFATGWSRSHAFGARLTVSFAPKSLTHNADNIMTFLLIVGSFSHIVANKEVWNLLEILIESTNTHSKQEDVLETDHGWGWSAYHKVKGLETNNSVMEHFVEDLVLTGDIKVENADHWQTSLYSMFIRLNNRVNVHCRLVLNKKQLQEPAICSKNNRILIFLAELNAK